MIAESFVAARADIKDQPETFERFGAHGTPTIIIFDSSGMERHRLEGFLPEDDFLAQLRLGLAHEARGRHDYKDAERRYRDLAADPTAGEGAAEALYWAGVARYEATGDPSALSETAEAFQGRFIGTSWAKKASVWAAGP